MKHSIHTTPLKKFITRSYFLLKLSRYRRLEVRLQNLHNSQVVANSTGYAWTVFASYSIELISLAMWTFRDQRRQDRLDYKQRQAYLCPDCRVV